jgi:S-adenosylmethionine hydrolase
MPSEPDGSFISPDPCVPHYQKENRVKVETPQYANPSSYPAMPRATSNLSLNFGAHQLYEGVFQGVEILADGDNIRGEAATAANQEIVDRFSKVLDFANQQRIDRRPHAQGWLGKLRQWLHSLWAQCMQRFNPVEDLFGLKLAPWTTKKHPLTWLPIETVPHAVDSSVDFASLSLLRLGGAEKNKKIFIHTVSPDAAAGSAGRTILVTREHGIYIGPNNGSLGLLYLRLLNEGDMPKLLQIDVNEVERLERRRLGDPQYHLSSASPGRDIFAVAAGLIAFGVEPESLAARDEKGRLKPVKPVIRPFAKMVKLPRRGETITAYALQDNTFGNLKLNIQLSDLQYNRLRQSDKKFQVRRPGSDEWIDLPLQKRFDDVPKGEFLMCQSSSYDGVLPGTKLLKIAANLDFAASRLGITSKDAQPLEIRCV